MVAAKPMTDAEAAALAAALLAEGGALWREILDEDLAAWAARLARHHFPFDRDAEAAKEIALVSIDRVRKALLQENERGSRSSTETGAPEPVL